MKTPPKSSDPDWKRQLEALCQECAIVTRSQIYQLLPPGNFLAFEEHMRGKTCPLGDNMEKCVYTWDLAPFIQKIRVPKAD